MKSEVNKGLQDPADRAPKPARAGLGLSLKGRALRYLAAREHSRAELQTKLARYAAEAGEDAQAVARVLDELTAKGFISEARVAESVLHRRAGRLGAARVLHELRAKGLPEELIADAAHQLRDTEQVRAHEVWCRKFGAPPQDAAERARQLRFLAARGFGGDVARRVIDESGEAGE